MTNGNQLLINNDTQTFYCYSCDRWFRSAHGALSHCRNARIHDGEWCECCSWLFVSAHALSDHLAHSSNHHVCEPCKLDFDETDDLSDHNAIVHPSRRHYGSALHTTTAVQQVPLRPFDPCNLLTSFPESTNLPTPEHRMLRMLRAIRYPLRHADASRIRCVRESGQPRRHRSLGVQRSRVVRVHQQLA